MKGDPRVPELFEQACELAGEERAAWLTEVGRDEPALAREIEELLHAERGAGELLEAAAWERLDAMELEPPAPARIGSYRIEREIGRGGMGRVYLAEQQGDGFRRQVALKLLNRSVISEEDVRRFRREVRLLATLEHPGIARFLDGGQAPDGTWYLALEFVEGVDLRAFIASRDLSVEERVRIFLAVLDPVAYAHAHSVVHRDLKPGNIIVGDDGRPRLLDFGIAKLLDAAGGESVTITAGGARALTPAYASPEQIRGEHVTPASDVHSLGVMLYELLAGVSPFRAASDSRAALESAVLTTDPAPPSAATQRRMTIQEPEGGGQTFSLPPPGRGRIGGELDAICLKALRKEPSSRYSDAAGLAADLRRYLAGAPVEASRGGRRYQIGRFMRRNRTHLTAAAVVALAAILSPIAVHFLGKPSPGPVRTGATEIAVLPFKPVDPGQRDTALEFAMTESLIFKFAEGENLNVKQLYAVRKFTDLAADPIQAGRELGVDYVLASTYQVADGRTRVTSQLIDVRTGKADRTVRSETGAGNVFAVQDSISHEIGNAVLASFGRSATRFVPRRGTDSEEAYNLYNSALYLIDKGTRRDSGEAAELLDRVVEMDPAYSQAWAVRAHAYCQFAHLGGGSPTSIFPVAEPMLERALSLDPDNAMAYTIRGTINRDYHWNFQQAYKDLLRAIELDPAGVHAYRLLAGVYYRDGRFAEAVEAEKKALDLHPTSLVEHKFLGDYLIAAGRGQEGIAQLNRVITMDPAFAPAYSSLWRIHHARGEEAQAFEYFITGKGLGAASGDDVASMRRIYEVSGWSGVLRAELERVRSEDPHGGYSSSKVYIAQLAAQLGESDLAFQYLEEAFEYRLIGLSYLKVDPLLTPLRKDRRYEDLVRRAGL